MRLFFTLCLLFASFGAVYADGPADNAPEKVRKVPPPPKEPLPDADRQTLQKGLDELAQEIESLHKLLAKNDKLLELLPDVQIYFNAVHYALKYDEFFDPKNEVPKAKKLLQTGMDRAKALKKGEHPWTTATGGIVRGYLSKIDGSVQPYGLVVPTNYKPADTEKHRLDIWCHGRGENLSEINFIAGRTGSLGEFAPAGAFVLHPYGRYCNANKFAGEIDVLEGIEAVKKQYPIDPQHLVMRGFSMGGAACWQFAVHYPTMWSAAAPGAGFSETRDFLKVFQGEDVSKAPLYEQKLWHLYDCTDYAVNLYNLPTIAYSGEIDKQKQAADMMEKALKAEGMTLKHIIGPKTGHSYHKDAKVEIEAFLKETPARQPFAAKLKFVTYTLRYNQCDWITVDGLQEQWEKGRVEAEYGKDGITITTKGITGLTVTLPPLKQPMVGIALDSQKFEVTVAVGDKHSFQKNAKGGWEIAKPRMGLAKIHGLQGPIDDAFMDRFIMVRPTGKPYHEVVGKWVDSEMKHALTHWRQQFRGEALVKDDKDISDDDIRDSNLILWGDPSSNAVLKRIADKLPIQWTPQAITANWVVGPKGQSAGIETPSKEIAVAMIYPNPLNPKKYIVLNSGFTFREYDYLNNARQIPKLPDWAFIDVSAPTNARTPGKIILANFFDEAWKVKPPSRD